MDAQDPTSIRLTVTKPVVKMASQRFFPLAPTPVLQTPMPQ
jgi:hypothetical protein